MQLVERGELDLVCPIQKYLPDFQPTSVTRKFTLRKLMSHPLVSYGASVELFRSDGAFPIGNGSQPDDTTLVYGQSHTKYPTPELHRSICP